MKKILLLAIILSSLKSPAQTKAIDSLKKTLDGYTIEDTIKASLLYNYGNAIEKTDIDASIPYAQKGIKLAGKLNRPDMVAYGELRLSIFYSRANKLDSAIFLALQGLDLSERLHLDNLVSEFHGVLGAVYGTMGNFKRAEFYDNKLLDAATLQKNDSLILRALEELITVYRGTGPIEKYKDILNRTLILAMKLKSEYILARLFWEKASDCQDLKDFQKAINYLHQSLVIWKKRNDHGGVAFTLSFLSNVFLIMNKKDSAGWYAYAALDEANKYKLRKEPMDAYTSLYSYHYKYKDYKNALEDRLVLDSLENKLEGAQKVQTRLTAEMKYDQEKKDLMDSIDQDNKEAAERRTRNLQYGVISAFVLLAVFLFYNSKQKQRAKINIEKAYEELTITQAQLVQSEKMASLGELTAGIAHEIQNPLNFINNFSEINKELLVEMQDEMNKGEMNEASVIADEVIGNEEKINHHGKRADSIVKGMLQHSRSSSGYSEPTDINALADEYFRLSYHGLRAKDNSFQSTMQTNFDKSVGEINIVPQDIGRVLLNLYNNAFYAVSERKKKLGAAYEPTVSLSTKKSDKKITISVKDNGNGIPQKVVGKIFQPFFTTKPTGQGTGLGLSLSYDIVRAHGGEIKVETTEGEGSELLIELPITK
jgi:two-component system, NtrC family, sensor kinase